MKLKIIIKEAVAPEEINTRKQTAIQNINNELTGLDLDTVDLQQLQAILTSIQVAKGDQPPENLSSLEEKKFTKKDIEKRDDIAKNISTKSLQKRYNVDKDEAESIKYAIASSAVKKSKKKKKK